MGFRALLDDVILAEADEVVPLEGTAYFPPDTVRWEHLTETDASSRCFWKGKASYFDADLGGRNHQNVAWTYHSPSRLAAKIADHVAFWGDVRVERFD